uniref:Uncharacterized protein n=1 Tax=Eutreptiella gymnastica TaxID=73025 RepID=A0A7S4FWZ6_9EUGL|mmetsp:Transcript_28930/g.49314  ORF Transcript_28930/g.49314 Transcript_28930/m.49314 type:complete len:121 (+) Transcript_28930:153-515(+)
MIHPQWTSRGVQLCSTEGDPFRGNERADGLAIKVPPSYSVRSECSLWLRHRTAQRTKVEMFQRELTPSETGSEEMLALRYLVTALQREPRDCDVFQQCYLAQQMGNAERVHFELRTSTAT